MSSLFRDWLTIWASCSNHARQSVPWLLTFITGLRRPGRLKICLQTSCKCLYEKLSLASLSLLVRPTRHWSISLHKTSKTPILEWLPGFQLTAANQGKLPVSMYVELDLNFFGIVVPKVWVLITQEPSELLDTCHKNKLPGVVGWNLIKLAYEVFVQKYGVLCLENFDCPAGLSPLLFSQLGVFHHCKAGRF